MEASQIQSRKRRLQNARRPTLGLRSAVVHAVSFLVARARPESRFSEKIPALALASMPIARWAFVLGRFDYVSEAIPRLIKSSSSFANLGSNRNAPASTSTPITLTTIDRKSTRLYSSHVRKSYAV